MIEPVNVKRVRVAQRELDGFRRIDVGLVLLVQWRDHNFVAQDGVLSLEKNRLDVGVLANDVAAKAARTGRSCRFPAMRMMDAAVDVQNRVVKRTFHHATRRESGGIRPWKAGDDLFQCRLDVP